MATTTRTTKTAKTAKVARTVKPAKKTATLELGNLPEQLTDNLTTAGRNVWLAGLGAVATVGTETTSLFETLVQKGRAREKKSRPAVERLVEETGDRLSQIGDRVGRLVNKGTTAALHKIGVPSREEIQTLIKRVEQLSAKVEYLATNRAAAVN